MRTLLENHGDTLGKCLGASARIFAGGRGEPDPGFHGPEDCRPFHFDIIPDDEGLPISPASSTGGFCSMVRAIFPELGTSKPIMAAMEFSSSLVLRAARHQYSESMELLWKICGCGLCEEVLYRPQAAGERQVHCLLALSEMVRKLIHMLSNCSYRSEARLRPTTSGLFQLIVYEASTTQALRKSIRQHIHRMGGGTPSLDKPPSSYKRLPVLHRLHLVFGGRRAPETGDEKLLALSGNGLVVYHETLSEMSSDPETVGKICIMAGGAIEWQATKYTKIVSELATDDEFGYNAKVGKLIDDMASSTVPQVSPNTPGASPNTLNVSSNIPKVSPNTLNAYLILDEHWGQPSANTLGAYYTIGRSDDANSRFRVDPLGIIQEVWAATSLQGPCSGTSRSCKFLEGQGGIVIEGEGYIDGSSLPTSSNQLVIVRTLDQDNLAIWVALSQMELASPYSGSVGFINILQEAQCLGCCIRQGAAYEATTASGRNGDWRDCRYQNPDEHDYYARFRKFWQFVCLANPRAANDFLPF